MPANPLNRKQTGRTTRVRKTAGLELTSGRDANEVFTQ
jgi:hypothetical protein